ncbi:MAG TPA: ComF family protein [Nitrospira sp.]|nr:ComF family protein [Nitrospira sp.]
MMFPGLSDVVGFCRLAVRAVLPIDCMSCDRPLRRDPTPYFCDACWDGITPLSGPRCACCDQPFASPAASISTPGHRCQSCLQRPPAYDRAWTLYPYSPPLQDAICALKYRSVFGLVNPLAALTIRALPEELAPDVIVPVPLHSSRLRTRGFNQSLLIADRLGRHLRRPVSATDLVRTIATEPQTSLTRAKRMRNLRLAFAVRRNAAFSGRRVLLIDDVFTTGTTLNECAKVLRSAGAASVSALTLARTIDSSLIPDRILAAHAARSTISRRN